MTSGPPEPDPKSPRVRVTGPRNRTNPQPFRSAASEIDAQSELGAIYMRSLLRTQLRLALAVIAVLIATVGTLPLIFAVAPEWSTTPVFGVPLAWVTLGLAVYPLFGLLGWWYVRAAERNERAFTDVVQGP